MCVTKLFSDLETVIAKWLAEYRAGWRRKMPIGGEPTDVPEIVQANADWLAVSNHPKLFINAEPGSLLIGRFRDFCRTWPDQDEIPVHGDHFAQEDSPAEIARPLQHFLRRVTT